MFVGERRAEEFFYYIHLMSDAMLTATFTVRMDAGRITSSTMSQMKDLMNANGVHPSGESPLEGQRALDLWKKIGEPKIGDQSCRQA